MLVLRILAFAFIIPGVSVVFAARGLVDKYGLDRNVKCEFENEMGEDEIKAYKYNKATVNLKMLGLLVALPGFIMIMIAFK